jgi:hypothetical protein
MEDTTMMDLEGDGEIGECRKLQLPGADRGRLAGHGKSEPKASKEKEEELNKLIDKYPLSIGRYITLQWNFNRALRKEYENPVVIIGELARSAAKGPGDHKIWRSLMLAAGSITVWQGNHPTWWEARQHSRMPRFPTSTQQRALRYLDPSTEDMAPRIMAVLVGIGLGWMVATGDRPSAFWRGARLNDPDLAGQAHGRD